MNDADPIIRTARRSDAEALRNIYAPYVENTVITFEYEVPSISEFADRMERVLERYPYLVAVIEGEIVGYAYASAFKNRAAYDWAVETSIYVKTGCTGKHIGSTLYEALERALSKMNVVNLNACIAYPNPESVGFHERYGYRMVGHFSKCGYKSGQWLDMIWMEKFLGEHKTPPSPVIPFGETE